MAPRVRPGPRPNSEQSVRETRPPLSRRGSKKVASHTSNSSTSRKASAHGVSPLVPSPDRRTVHSSSRRSIASRKISSRLSVIAHDVDEIKRRSINVLTDGIAQLKHTLTANGPTKREMPTGPSFQLPPPTPTRPATRRRSIVAKLGTVYQSLEKRVSQNVLLCFEAVQLVYTAFSVPFRLGFMYNPHFASSSSATSDVPDYVMYILWALDIVFDVIALVAALRILKNPDSAGVVVPVGASEPSFTARESHHRRNSAFQQSLVKFAITRQQTMRRNSTFLSKETSMKPQFLLSSTWDKQNVVGKYHVIAEWLALIPFDFVFVGQPHAMILCRAPKLLRLHKVPEIARLLKQALAEHERLPGFHNVGMSLLVGVLLLSLALMHWATCLFFLVAHVECGFDLAYTVNGHQCWANLVQLEGASIFRTYMYSLVVVGFGFPLPQTNLERVLGITIHFMRFCIGGAAIGAYVFLFECQNRRANDFHDQVDGVKKYLTARRLPKLLQAKVLDFYEHFWSAQRGIDEDSIIATLPTHIQTQCLDLLRAKLLKTVPVFRSLPMQAVKRLMLCMKRQCYGRGDWILRLETCKFIYFICRGRISVLDADGAVTKNIVDGQHFGLSIMDASCTDLISARAETICDLYIIDKPSIERVYKAYESLMPDVNWDDLVAEATRLARKAIRANSKLGLGTKLSAQDTKDALMWSHPESHFRRVWEHVMIAALIVCGVDIPVHICFDTRPSWVGWVFRVALELFLLADLALRSRRFAYFENGTLISDPWFIWQQYKQSGFLLDAFSMVPFTIIADIFTSAVDPNSTLLLVITKCEWIRLLRIRRLLPTLSAALKRHHVNDTTSTIVNMLLCVAFACHLGGCVWYWIAAIHVDVNGDLSDVAPTERTMTLSVETCLMWARDFQNCTWLDYDHDQYGYPSDYVRAFYWSAVSLVSVQFGSIFPFTDAECVYMFLFLYLSIVINYGAVGALVNAVTRINSATSKKQDQVTIAHRFMTAEGVSHDVRLHISNYYKTHWSHTSEQHALTVLQPLPDNLRQEIQSCLHEASVKYLQLFKAIDADGLRFIYTIMRHQVYNRDEFVVRSGDTCDDIYILTRGVLERLVAVKDLDVPVQLLFPGACVGEAAFVLKRSHEMGVRVVSESADVSVLSRHDFASISHHFDHVWSAVESLAKGLDKVQSKERGQLIRNLQKPNIYRTLTHSTTLYIEPKSDEWLVRPDSTLYRVWELVVAVLVLYNLIQIPFRVSMLPTPPDHVMVALTAVDVFCDVIFLVDMYIKCNHLIIFDKNGDQVVSVAQIRASYFHGHAFKLEALASLPLYYVGDYSMMTLCRLPRLLRCGQLSTYLRSFHTFVQEKTASAAVTEGLEFVELFLALLLAAHISATVLYWISHAEQGADDGLSTSVPNSPDSIFAQFHGAVGATYLRAFYWGLGVLSSFDYMDMMVSKSGESLWLCVVALSGVVFVGVIIGQVCTAIFNANKEIRQVEMQLENFAFYAKMKKLPKFMVRRAKLFFQYQLDCNKGMDAHRIFLDLPQCLRLELFKDLYAKLLTPLPIFATLTKAQINSIAARLRSNLYLPGDDIIMEGDVGGALYIMRQGLGEKYLRSSQLIVAPVYEGSLFGEVAFFLGTRYTYNVRAVKCCEVLTLTKTDWSETWSHEVSLKFKVKMAVGVQKESHVMDRIVMALKQNFGVDGKAPIKLASMLGVKKRASFRARQAGETRRDSVPNYFDYIRENSRAGPRKAPHLSQFAPTPRATIWHAAPPRVKLWMPHSAFRNGWDVAMLAVTIYYASIVPFRACFVEFTDSTPYWVSMWFAGEYALDVVTIVDFILRFQVFYVFAKGEMQTEMAVLRRHYREHGPFWKDVLALFPVEVAMLLIPHASVWKAVSVCRLNRMIRVVHLPHLVHTFERVLSRRKWFVANRTVFEFVVTFVAPFFLVRHWIACLWFFMSVAASPDLPSWLASTGFLGGTTTTGDDATTTEATSVNLYLGALNYAVSALNAQSFGDVFDQNALETWLTLAIILFSIAFYGVLVGMLAEMMQDKLRPRASFEQHMVDVSTFFNYRLLPFDFFIQTSRFSRLQWQNHLGRTEDDFLSVLSTTIRADIAMYVKQNVVRSLRFLDSAEEVFVRALVTKLHTEEFIHADVIYQFGDVSRTLFFIDVGEVSLVSSATGVQARKTHQFFGGVSLFEDTGRTVTAIANVECTMFLLHHDAFEKLMDRFPEYYDRCYTQWSVRDEDSADSLVVHPSRATIQSGSPITKLVPAMMQG